MASIVTAYIGMAYVVMAYVVMALCSYGLHSYGLYSYGPYSYGISFLAFDSFHVPAELCSLYLPPHMGICHHLLFVEISAHADAIFF